MPTNRMVMHPKLFSQVLLQGKGVTEKVRCPHCMHIIALTIVATTDYGLGIKLEDYDVLFTDSEEWPRSKS